MSISIPGYASNNMWIGIKNPSLSSCFWEECDGFFKWYDGGTIYYEDYMGTNGDRSESSKCPCSRHSSFLSFRFAQLSFFSSWLLFFPGSRDRAERASTWSTTPTSRGRTVLPPPSITFSAFTTVTLVIWLEWDSRHLNLNEKCLFPFSSPASLGGLGGLRLVQRVVWGWDKR